MKVTNETLKRVDIIAYVIYMKSREVPIIGGVFGEWLTDQQVATMAIEIEKFNDTSFDQDDIDEITICRQ